MLLNFGMQELYCSEIYHKSNPFNFTGMEPFYQTAA